jgi:hypothetical protein
VAIPLNFKGGFQLTESNSATSALLRFNSKAPSTVYDGTPPTSPFPAKLYLLSESFQVLVDTVYSNSISLQFGGHNLAFTGNYTPSTYQATTMFLMF